MEYGTTLFTVVVATIKILFMVLGFAMPLASILTWMERRQSAMMQDRLGPNRANIGPFRAWGITHFLADALKFMAKEDFVPPKAHKFLFMWAPIMAMAPALIVSAIVPFGSPLCWGQLTERLGPDGVCAQPIRLQIAQLDAGLLFYFAISSLAVYGATLAGWASHNKWAMMGGLRASSQMMSYEVTMGMAVLGSFLVYGTLEPGAIVAQQRVDLRPQQPAAQLGHLLAAARLPAVSHRGHRRDQAHAVRHPRRRAGDHRLLRRVLGPALRHVLPGRVPGDRLLERHHDHAVLRRLALGRRPSTASCRRTSPTACSPS